MATGIAVKYMALFPLWSPKKRYIGTNKIKNLEGIVRALERATV